MNFKSRNKVSAEFNMSSMTDLVFLLLIFFILTSAVVTTSALDIILPKSKAQTVKKHDVTITISEDMVFKVDGEIVTPESIENAVLAKAAGNPEAVIILRVDKTVATGETVRILDIGYRNRLKMIIATDPND
jgi:biopolymer transport protein ExbD